jgi:hypothetical protein
MAQSHKFCDHPATKAARARCRRERETTGTDYAGGWENAHKQGQDYCEYCGLNGGSHLNWCIHRPKAYQPPPRYRSQSAGGRRAGPYPRHSCCGNYHAQGHTSWCSNNPNPGNGDSAYQGSGHRGGDENIWDTIFGGPLNDREVLKDNGGYKVRDHGKGREDLHRDDQGRTPQVRRIVQLERKAASTTAHEAAACMAAARRLREAAGLLGQVI